jgi:dipeptidyl-peptidase-4
VVGVDEKAGIVYFEGRKDTPLENHLYVAPLGGGDITRLTEVGYWHQVETSRDYSHFVDRYSSAWPSLTAPAVRLLKLPASGDASDATKAQEIFSNRLDDLSHPIHPYRDSLGQVTFGTLTAGDGATLHYRLIQPANLTPGLRCPVIVTVYGGPGVQRVTNEWIPPWHHYMASRGYVLFQLDNRGSANRGRTFEAPIHMALGTAEVDDQLLGVEFLSTLPFTDPARIGVFGHSYGGYMTLMLMAKAPDKFRAGISVAPVSDWLLYDTHYTERFLGMPDANAEGYHQSSVFPFLNTIAGELLLIHGMADDNVLFTHSTRLYKALQEANIPFEMMNYPGAKHGISGRRTNIHRYGTMDRFLDRHLKGAS